MSFVLSFPQGLVLKMMGARCGALKETTESRGSSGPRSLSATKPQPGCPGCRVFLSKESPVLSWTTSALPPPETRSCRGKAQERFQIHPHLHRPKTEVGSSHRLEWSVCVPNRPASPGGLLHQGTSSDL